MAKCGACWQQGGPSQGPDPSLSMPPPSLLPTSGLSLTPPPTSLVLPRLRQRAGKLSPEMKLAEIQINQNARLTFIPFLQIFLKTQKSKQDS